MTSAKDIVLKPISRRLADATVRHIHYSGKVCSNSQLHIGVFLNGKIEGALQFGPSMDKSKVISLVEGTEWNGFIELNRMAFSDALPRNSESRAISIAMRYLKARAPHLKWVISFSDATQCGDGTIYRASGFTLTGINENSTIYEAPNGEKFASITLTKAYPEAAAFKRARKIAAEYIDGPLPPFDGRSSMKIFAEAGFKKMPGFQLRYIYFLDPSCRSKLVVPEIPFSEIKARGAQMYKGKRPD